MKVRFFLFTIFLVFSFFTINSDEVLADQNNASESANLNIASLSANIKNKIEQIKQEVASKAALLKLEVNKKLQNKVYSGKIKRVSDQNTIVIESRLGEETLRVNEYTTYLDQTQKASKKGVVSLKDLSVGDTIAALGDADESRELTAKKIVKIDPVKPLDKQTVWGQILQVRSDNISLKQASNSRVTLVISGNTSFLQKEGDAGVSDAKVDNFLIAIGYLSDNNLLKTDLVYLLPSTKNISLKAKVNNATSSAVATSSSKLKK